MAKASKQASVTGRIGASDINCGGHTGTFFRFESCNAPLDFSNLFFGVLDVGDMPLLDAETDSQVAFNGIELLTPAPPAIASYLA